jgi:DNA polymerase V
MPIIALVDANNFYASAEQAFNPRLTGRVIVVLSNNDGCVVARSKEAKRIGIPMAAPLFEIRNLLERHNAVILSSNYPLYADMSYRFQATLENFSPDIEHYSIDEAFVQMPLSAYQTLTETGREMRRQIYDQTGIPVSVGFARTKTLTKIAIELAKTSAKTGGVLDLVDSSFLNQALERVMVADVWNVGRSYTALLERNGIKNALQLRDADDKWIRQHMTVTGLRTVHELRGQPCIEFQPIPKVKQQLCCSLTFGEATDDMDELRAAIASFTARVGEKLREHRLLAGELVVFVTTDRFKKDDPQYSASHKLTIAPKSDNTLELMPLAMAGLSRIYRPGFGIRKAGVMLNDLELAECAPRRLWDSVQYEVQRRLMDFVDGINERFGRDSLRCGLWPNNGVWRTRSGNRSPEWTTDWRQVMAAH